MKIEGSLPCLEYPRSAPILSQIITLHALPSCLLKIEFNNITLSTPRSFKWSLSLRFPNSDLYRTLFSLSLSLVRATFPAHLILLFVPFRNMLNCYGDELLASRPTSNQEDHPLSTIRDSLFIIFATDKLIQNKEY